MNNLQLVAWAKRTGRLVIHNPSPRNPFYTCVAVAPLAGQMGFGEPRSISHASLPVALDMACEHLRGEALIVEPRMA